ncbi:hypothetical protein NX037_21405 [Escherichia coli]|nr:hypothetical protein [Escherichia coli]MCS1366743.1 hypothetical protein [Escherichia coli]MDS1578721.1 hypothetical protein [Escherichia coli]
MEKKNNLNKKAAASANVAVGTRLNSEWFEKINSELLALFDKT